MNCNLQIGWSMQYAASDGGKLFSGTEAILQLHEYILLLGWVYKSAINFLSVSKFSNYINLINSGHHNFIMCSSKI